MNIFFYWRIITLAFGLQASKKVVEAGYFVNILKFPSLCPLTSFCAPWNPVTGSKSIELINHNKINLTIDGLYILRPRGRLKNNIACWAHAENATTAWCQLYSDTGIVFCNEEDRGYDDDQMITRYMVPKNCVEWKTDSDHMTNAFYTSIVLIVGRKDRGTHLIITGDKVTVDDKNFTWNQVMANSIRVGNTTILHSADPLSAAHLTIKVDSILTLVISQMDLNGGSSKGPSLSMSLNSLHHFWSFSIDPDMMATNDELGGLLGDSGFLEALYLAEQSSRLDISVKRSFGCNPVAWYSYRYPLCRCQLARLEHIPLRFPKDLRRQACCDWWLGKSLQGKEKGKLPNGIKRHIYFNDRLACAQGTEPLNDLDRSCDDNFCCSKTHLEVAGWDFKVRGKCRVLRSLKPDDPTDALESDKPEENKITRRSLGAAWGIMGLTSMFLITFRFVTSKLDECRAKAHAGFKQQG